MGAYVLFTVFLFQRGSSESKDRRWMTLPTNALSAHGEQLDAGEVDPALINGLRCSDLRRR